MNVTTATCGKENPMSTFTIDTDDNITAHDTAEQASATGFPQFGSAAELTKLATEWPMARLIEIWNSIPGNTPVKKFENRTKAVARIWKAVESLGRSTAAPPRSKQRKPGKKSATARKTRPDERTNKKAAVIAMMKRAKGATLAEIMAATDWQAHTVRGFVSILASKAGLTVESTKSADGTRTYRITK